MAEYREIQYQQWERTATYWLSAWRDGHSRAYEFLEINLSQPRLISTIKFNVEHWPQRVSIDYWDGGRWLPWTSRVNVGNSTVCNIMDSWGIPGRSQQWIYQEFHPVIRTVQRFRVAARRLVWEEPWWVNTHRHPRTTTGKLATYPIAISDLDVLYTATRREEIPRPAPPPAPVVPPPPVVVGDRHSYTLHQREAQQILPDYAERIGATTPALVKQAGIQTRFWKCEPQPVPYAVVNFYADTRDDDGLAQTVSRFFIDPLYTGPAINLYYSNDTPTGSFEANHHPIPYAMATLQGGTAYDRSKKALVFPANVTPSSAVSIEGRAVDLNLSQSWWVGMQVGLDTAASNIESRPLLDIDGKTLYLTNGRVNLSLNAGQVLRQEGVEHAQGSRLWIIAGYDAAASRAFLYTRLDDGEVSFVDRDITSLQPDRVAKEIHLGHSSASIGGEEHGGFSLYGLVIKSGVLPSEDDVERFIADSTDYTRHSDLDDRDIDSSTDNSLLRFLPDRVTSGVPTGLYGGSGDFYEDLSWTPIMRNFRAAKGYMDFPPTRAKFWKFEFTNLVSEPYDVIEPVQRSVKIFPFSVLSWYRTAMARRAIPPKSPTVDPGVETVSILANALRFTDSSFVSIVSRYARRYTPTEAFHVLDPNTGARLADVSSHWRMWPWHQPNEAPIWTRQGKHAYDIIEVVHKEKVAFFAGLKELVPVLVDYQAEDDTDQYVEPFINLDNVESSTFTLQAGGVGFDMEDGYLTSGETSLATATSKVFPSNRRVRAVQFATTQSTAVQMLTDHDFNDPLHLSWTPVGDVEFVPDTVEIGGLGNTLGARRTGQQETGGVESAAVEVADGGRVHVAVRASGPLTAPLWAQVIDADTGTVLTEQAVTISGTEPMEWFVSISLGDYPAVDQVAARVVQKATTTDTWYLDDVSIYEDPIVWEFTVDGTNWVPAIDVRNNPHGVVTFPDDQDPTSNRSLQWRVTAYRPHSTIGGLVIRPWYHGLLSGIAPRIGQNAGGPSISSYDQYPPIEADPRFRSWSNPIPHDWWLSFRSLYLNMPKPLLGQQSIMVHQDLVSGVNSR